MCFSEHPPNGRQKIEAALSRDGSPEFAAVICYEDIYFRDRWRDLTDYPWWYAQEPDISRQLAWRRQVFPKIGQDWFYLPDCLPRVARTRLAIQTRGERAFLVDGINGEEEELPEPVVGGWEAYEHGYSGHVAEIASTPAEIDHRIPPVEAFDAEQFLQQGSADLARDLLGEFGPAQFSIYHVTTPLWHCYYLWGFEGMMSMIATSPELVEYACQRYLGRCLNTVHQAAALGAGGVWLEDCLTDMISPSAFQRLNLPFVRMLVDEIRAHGMKSIYYFCGDPSGKLELLLEAGADALSLEESKKGFNIDITELAEFVQGRCTLLGNLDAIHLLPHASEEELRHEIQRQVQAGRLNRNRFIMSLGSPVTPQTPPQRVRLYCELTHELSQPD